MIKKTRFFNIIILMHSSKGNLKKIETHHDDDSIEFSHFLINLMIIILLYKSNFTKIYVMEKPLIFCNHLKLFVI